MLEMFSGSDDNHWLPGSGSWQKFYTGKVWICGQKNIVGL